MITEQQTYSLIEKYRNDKGTKGAHSYYYPQRTQMKRELEYLLEMEAQGELCDLPIGEKFGKELLAEYRSNFDWEEEYSVKVNWELVIWTYNHEYRCESKEEAFARLSGKVENEQPDLDLVLPCYKFSGDCSRPTMSIRVINLKPKVLLSCFA